MKTVVESRRRICERNRCFTNQRWRIRCGIFYRVRSLNLILLILRRWETIMMTICENERKR
uniref:Uncharacterized protein n=1 Tax=uncultured marine virus TaxID=186617 RepID=A0A0F7L524_9VIRU|nr:hypothetical protein [uncultured marine virus]